MGAQTGARKFQLQASAAICASTLPSGANAKESLHERADGRRGRGRPRSIVLRKCGGERVLDHLCAHAHQTHRVLVETAIVAGDV